MSEANAHIGKGASRSVAVDGPAGSGKSSVSRAAALRLGFGFLDTGAAYRAFAWQVDRFAINLDDKNQVAAALDSWHYKISTDPELSKVTVDGVDVSKEIRTPEISARVSAVAGLDVVRERLTGLFRYLVASEARDGIVVEGRDITTRVLPDAPARVLLTAHPDVRASRRAAEADVKDNADSQLHSFEATRLSIADRDMRDMQVVDFMTPAEGVILLDSTDLSFSDTVTRLVEIIRERVALPAVDEFFALNRASTGVSSGASVNSEAGALRANRQSNEGVEDS